MHVYPVHRLDRPVSGVVLFALSSASAAQFQEALGSGSCIKEYSALVRGEIGAAGRSERPLTNRDTGRIQEASTEWEPTRTWTVPSHGPISLIRVRIHTGRRHQIRRHLAHERHAILGDTTHGKGGVNRFMREEFGLGRIFLHASRLALEHPETGMSLVVESSLPSDLARVLESLEAQESD
jgi:tRNA pseudouridine65 synthase